MRAAAAPAVADGADHGPRRYKLAGSYGKGLEMRVNRVDPEAGLATGAQPLQDDPPEGRVVGRASDDAGSNGLHWCSDGRRQVDPGMPTALSRSVSA